MTSVDQSPSPLFFNFNLSGNRAIWPLNWKLIFSDFFLNLKFWVFSSESVFSRLKVKSSINCESFNSAKCFNPHSIKNRFCFSKIFGRFVAVILESQNAFLFKKSKLEKIRFSIRSSRNQIFSQLTFLRHFYLGNLTWFFLKNSDFLRRPC